ncbi:MAG: AbrB/MazE/SpoVT family DNA-binding domain-containing protein [Candidatus Marinimicrobia bacterium]|jgi:AbrB family looped-hinge helix DNA binding protein|nr:AbrB/MazE/SpoVT family DNA-binding domain-containing protein [Candidatus Neomarinimicrobiota bacterium]MBT3496814.1 AbrB/MazE/SpoVT family DNA-binding domain-containing protein [Candidatus Neomarinimicrobiota bacterium]MBT3732336.1 AbrB/MazE/SpoVT family DNA-binding domain-containing protein [Candidatus Neomarinimicrobiota bacterium]MBT4144293.1 AbrB/MazE/SpoVT family DNA-binding domain-containing protein [Candidatus Neomarinimicrobiota bacterium]MBT4177659.1 AbrB/MazE/SpoVT family DNA-bindi
MSDTLQMRKRGTLTLPKKIRDKYTLDEGDPLTLIDLGDGILISPKISVLPKLVSKIEALMDEKGVLLEELIQGIAEERAPYKKR